MAYVPMYSTMLAPPSEPLWATLATTNLTEREQSLTNIVAMPDYQVYTDIYRFSWGSILYLLTHENRGPKWVPGTDARAAIKALRRRQSNFSTNKQKPHKPSPKAEKIVGVMFLLEEVDASSIGLAPQYSSGRPWTAIAFLDSADHRSQS